ncbi:hypothetical protein SAMN04487775_10663 [Treponema bryantii]|uniref:DUF192 domain-containing protein n=1 Tax=Treponema bryantii TaxID=163 RepID=A0A1I3L609_9SPIR|nr:DUF192 domain-containing protein [Treponema bryantii]SFI80117.1 hypothetical protein SAMN04487775_10663 [Treponema bryantii]
MKKSIFILSLLLLTPFLSCKTKKLPVQDVKIIRQDGTEFIVKAEMAIKAEDRNHGFMERKNIPDGTGMLFVFERDQILSFWMHNTPHPLSIAYIDSKGKIRDIFDMNPYSTDSILSTVSVRYALEVPQGWYKKNDITTGDTVVLP